MTIYCSEPLLRRLRLVSTNNTKTNYREKARIAIVVYKPKLYYFHHVKLISTLNSDQDITSQRNTKNVFTNSRFIGDLPKRSYKLAPDCCKAL